MEENRFGTITANESRGGGILSEVPSCIEGKENSIEEPNHNGDNKQDCGLQATALTTGEC